MDVLPPGDSLEELRSIKQEYEAAIQVETDPEEKWRIREMLRAIDTRVRELEALS